MYQNQKEIRDILDEYVIGQEDAKNRYLLQYTTITNESIQTVKLMTLSYQK